MAGSVKHELPEHWTELTAARAQKERCAKDIESLKMACAVKCGKKNVSECQACHARVLDMMQRRYCEASDREWFKHRRAFINELGVLFAEAKEGKVDLQAIEARIESEKEAWYRWVLRTYPEFLSIADSGVDQEELRAMLDDPDKTREQLVEKVWEGVGKPPNWVNDMTEFVKRFEASKQDPAELKKLYISIFFKDGTGTTLPNAQKYLDEFQARGDISIVDAIDKLVLDERASKNSQPQRDTHVKRLDELQRAKTAFEQNRKQAKLRRQEAQARGAADELYNPPPCTTCGKTLEPKALVSCTTCQAMVHLGDPRSLAFYCNRECFRRNFGEHELLHECMAGDYCAGDEDENMDDEDESVICKVCVEAKNPTGVWCSEQCAFVNLPRHREEMHGLREPMSDIKTMVLMFDPLRVKTMKELNPKVKFKRI